MPANRDARQFAPATQRNRDPILQVLQRVLPARGTVLELASGTGEHAAFFAPRLAPLAWLPSEADPRLLASIEAWRQQQGSDNLYPAIALDVRDPVWPIEQDGQQEDGFAPGPIAAMASINLLHIAPWCACLGLLAGAQRLLPAGGVLYCYGPFKRGGRHTAASNAAFDESLRAQNPDWGVRDLDAVAAAARDRELMLRETVAMPANNLSLVFQRAPRAA